MERHPKIFWSPCAACGLDLMLEDIGKLEWVKSCVERAKNIYNHALVHPYLCGLVSIASLSSFWYYVTYIDDYSHRYWIHFLKSKEFNEVLSHFQEFKALVENLSNKRIKILKFDNGGEYVIGIFHDYYVEVGIEREFCVPYNPQKFPIILKKMV